MNQLKGTIKNIKSAGGITQVFIEVEDKLLSALILSSDEEYNKEESVNLLFKETEVMIATKESKVSARNCFVSPVISIEAGEILTQVEFDFFGTKISAIITKGALEEFGFKVGDELMWFIKSNEISIQKR